MGLVAAGTVLTVKEWEEFRTLSEQTLHRINSPKVRTERENVYLRPLASNQTAIVSFVLS